MSWARGRKVQATAPFPGTAPPGVPFEGETTDPSVAFSNCVDLLHSQGTSPISPLKGTGLSVMGLDESHEPLDQFLAGLEDAPSNDLASQDAEEDLDLMEPTGVGGV